MPRDDFAVHPQLTNDCALVGDLDLNRVLLMRDARFPWLILVPRIDGLRDFHELPSEWRERMFDEIERTSLALQTFAEADKLNVAALGNQVPQLHIHVIARSVQDAAWPGPVWGVGKSEPYAEHELSDAVSTFRATLGCTE